MNTSMQPGRDAASSWRRDLRPLLGTRALCGWTLLLLLGWGSATPARAMSGTISSAVPGPINVLDGETLTIVTNGSVAGSVTVNSGGTLIMTGGSVSGDPFGVVVNGGTATISGGSVSSGYRAVDVSGGTATISGGSVTVSSFTFAVAVGSGGTLNITGGSVSGEGGGVQVNGGGTATLTGGSVSGSPVSRVSYGVQVNGGGTAMVSGAGSVSAGGYGVAVGGGGTATISGGSVRGVSSAGTGVLVNGGTATISGGAVGGGAYGVVNGGGTATVSGCNLAVANGVLTGTLLYGTTIDTRVLGPITFDPPQPLITTDPASQTVCAGNRVSFTAAATGLVSGAPTVQWQVSANGGSAFSNIPGATAATLTFTAAAADDGKLYRAVFTDDCNPATTSAASLTLDTTVPSITTCPPAQTAAADSSCQAAVPDFTAGVVASSNCGAVTITQDPAAKTLVGTGVHPITLTATDAAMHSTSCTTSFTVVDTTPPAITMNGASPMTVECHTSFSDPGATANDACAGSVTVISSGSVDPSTPDSYTLTYTATDPDGNTATSTRAVNVVDTTKPVITLPANLTQAAAPGQCSALVSIGTATATDTCAGSLTPVGTRSDGKALTVPYPVGTTTLTWTASDGYGNTATRTSTVTVVDTTAPVITLNGDSAVTVECHTSFTDPGATASDACAGSVPATRSGPLDVNTPGSYTLTYTASDGNGNTATRTRTVSVVDTLAPVVTPPANLTQAAAPGQCSALVSIGTATATDTCAGSLTPVGTRSDGRALAAPYPVGATTLTWTATDPAGHAAAASQTVIVTDTQKPTLTCPANLTVPATSTSGAIVSYPAPTASDNCGTPAVLSSPASGSAFPMGPTSVTCTATDAAGNTQTCSFTVTVLPVADLSVTASADQNPVATGSNLTYTVTVQNAGPQPAQGVVLADPLPGGTAFVSATRSLSAGTLTTPKAGSVGTVTWNIGTLASGQSVTLTVVVKVTAKAGATINHIASVTSSTSDPNSGNNSATISTTVKAKR